MRSRKSFVNMELFPPAGLQGVHQPLPQRCIARGLDHRLQARGADQPEPEESGHEGDVLFTPGSKLAEREIVRLEAPADGAARVLVVDCDETLLPAGSQSCGVRSNPIGVIAECLVEPGVPAEASFD